jgi:hypothetical protein
MCMSYPVFDDSKVISNVRGLCSNGTKSRNKRTLKMANTWTKRVILLLFYQLFSNHLKKFKSLMSSNRTPMQDESRDQRIR